MLRQNDALLPPFNFQPLFQGTRRNGGNLVIDKTSVESVKLGKTLDLSTESGLQLDIFHSMLDRVKECQKLYGSSYLCEESLSSKF